MSNIRLDRANCRYHGGRELIITGRAVSLILADPMDASPTLETGNAGDFRRRAFVPRGPCHKVDLAAPQQKGSDLPLERDPRAILKADVFEKYDARRHTPRKNFADRRRTLPVG